MIDSRAARDAYFARIRIIAMSKCGHSAKTIADTLGCSKKHVQNVIAQGDTAIPDPPVEAMNRRFGGIDRLR